MSKHTPGPWHILCEPRPNDLHPLVSIYTGEDRREHIVCNSCTPEDAKLVAAAPELLEKLEIAIQWNFAVPPKYRMDPDQLRAIRELIAKAKGTP